MDVVLGDLAFEIEKCDYKREDEGKEKPFPIGEVFEKYLFDVGGFVFIFEVVGIGKFVIHQGKAVIRL